MSTLILRSHILKCRKILVKSVSKLCKCAGNEDYVRETLFIPYQKEPTKARRKISVFGAGGRVGVATAYTLYLRNFVDEIVMCDIDKVEKKVTGEALDMIHCGCLNHHPKVKVSVSFEESANSDVIILACGAPRKKGQTRLDLAQVNVDVYKEIVPKAVKYSPDAVILVESNPVDILCYAAWKYSCFDKNRIVGIGSELDSSRFRFLIAQRLGVNPYSLNAWILGEHGDSSVPNWSGVHIAGTKLREVDGNVGNPYDQGNWKTVYKKMKECGALLNSMKGFSSWGISLATTNVAYAVIKNDFTVHGVSLLANGIHDIDFDVFMSLPAVIAILQSLCTQFLSVNVTAILYLTNYEQYGRSTASAQYFLQLAGYLGIPVIAWNADNSGLERKASQSSLQLQLAPSLDHQTAAMLSILERYKWHQFSVVTSQIAGHDDFVQAVREKVFDMQDRFKFTILNSILVTKPGDLVELVDSEARVMLLYCTREEAIDILTRAKDLKLTGENYVWVVTQSVIENMQSPSQFPVGMLGVHFDTSSASLVNEITTAIKVFAYGVEDYISDPKNAGHSLNTQLSCEGAGAARWHTGDRFFRYLRNVSVEADSAGKPPVEFNQDGVLKATELKIMNLRPGVSKQLVWEEVGVWKSWQKEGLDIKDIVWPGNSHTPPQGVPEKFHLKITFLEEPPYINLAPPDPITGKCSMDRGVLCRVASDTDISEVDMSQAHRNGSFYQCCSGFCIDLLEKFSEELGFTYELVRVEDGRWGTLSENGRWNGLIADLVNRKTDMVMTSLMINSEREAVVDFSVPFMETGIAIVVAKRTGIISPTAFLEPFDTASWMLVGVVAIQAATFTIFLFEWLSPSGFNMRLNMQQVASSTSHRFSLFRTYWLVWAVLFQAAVHVDSPRGFTSRFMTNVWAMFAVVFLAIYTANLAAFMITREEFHEFSGVDDYRLSKPYSHKPMYKFGTIPWSHTDSTIAKYFKEMHSYMRTFNKTTVQEGVDSVLSGDLDAFIYDGTVLDYLVAQDEDCRLLTVGSWYAMTGYGLAFSRNSKYLEMFNKRLLDFRENGDLERLRRYWMTGSCKPGKQEHKSSDPLALEQFLSAFLLLMAGILIATLLLLLEHLYFKYVRKHLAKSDRGGCCALVSLSMGKSLTFAGAVYEAQDILRYHRCKDPICDTHLWKVKHELDMSQMRVKQLEKELESHGLKPPPKRQSTASEMAKARLRGINADFLDSDSNIYRPCRTEIAEMETVL